MLCELTNRVRVRRLFLLRRHDWVLRVGCERRGQPEPFLRQGLALAVYVSPRNHCKLTNSSKASCLTALRCYLPPQCTNCEAVCCVYAQRIKLRKKAYVKDSASWTKAEEAKLISYPQFLAVID